MKLHVASVAPGVGASQCDRLRELEVLDERHEHELVGDPEEADAILLVDLHLVDNGLDIARQHSLRQRHPEKTVVYCDQDRPWCGAPGLYVSMPSRGFRSQWQRATMYYAAPMTFADQEAATAPDLLFSFVGARTHKCREAILSLRHERAIVEDSGAFLFHAYEDVRYKQRVERYQEVMLRSKFILCPRGHGTASFRVLEALAAGRVPVIISDEWVPPREIDWSPVSIRIPERAGAEVVPILVARENDFPAMSSAARELFRTTFGPSASFHRIAREAFALCWSSDLGAFPRRGCRDRTWARLQASSALRRIKLATVVSRAT